MFNYYLPNEPFNPNLHLIFTTSLGMSWARYLDTARSRLESPESFGKLTRVKVVSAMTVCSALGAPDVACFRNCGLLT